MQGALPGRSLGDTDGDRVGGGSRSLGRMGRRGPRPFLVLVAVLSAGACAEPETPAGGLGSRASASAPIGRRQALLCPDGPGGLARFAENDLIERVVSPGGAFKVHFTRTPGSPNAVPGDDGDDDGVPDRVALVAETFDEVLAFYEGLGFRPPRSDAEDPECSGGDGLFDVYLVDLTAGTNGFFQPNAGCGPGPEACSGFLVLDATPSPTAFPTVEEAVRTLASHELFHAVQAAYDATEDFVVTEGTAVWASERFDPSLNDFESFIGEYLAEPTRSLDDDRPPILGFPYGSAIFFQFLEEDQGPGIIRDLWEASVGEVTWLDALPGLLAERGDDFEEAFARFAEWNLRTGERAGTGPSYEGAADYPPVRLPPSTPLPVEERVLDLRHAATRYLVVDVGDRSEVRALLLVPEDRATSVASLRPFLAALDEEGRPGPALPLEAPAADRWEGTLTVPEAGNGQVVLAIPNGRERPPSLQPILCLGSPSEVDACEARLDPTGRPDDAGIGPPPDAGVDDDGSRGGDGGCRVGSAVPAGISRPMGLTLLGWLAGGGLRRRRRSGRRTRGARDRSCAPGSPPGRP